MSLIVQDDTGFVAGANSYLTVKQFRDYWLGRGITFEQEDDELVPALILATDYMDTRFNFLGRKCQGREQTTVWPRLGVRDKSGYIVDGIPTEVLKAQAEYARRAITAALVADPSRDETGAAIQSKSVAVEGAVSESITYASGAAYSMPTYPAADRLLTMSGFVTTGTDIMRA